VFLDFRAEASESLPPDDQKAGEIFGRLGYRFADAVADLVDNSLDAGARNVHVRFVHSTSGIHSVVIADDGAGMNDGELKEAMRFGSKSVKSGSHLGKYGIGLKSASLSQADKVTVLSRRGRAACGRRWTLPNVKKNWSCDILNPTKVRAVLEAPVGQVRFRKSGTVVVWEELEHLKALPSNIEKVLDRTIRELQTELGIRFHRFLQTAKLTIGIDQQLGIEQPSDIPIFVSPLDPFGYDEEQSPNKKYPLTLSLLIGTTKLNAECHIWPPKTNALNYKLGGGKVALRQGFYFYRNDRIIQAGGWNQLRVDDSEPHLSLARVKIDLPAALDSKFKLDVTKSRLDPAPEFTSAMDSARGKDGIDFHRYLLDAQGAYRKNKIQDGARFPVIPGSGLSAKARSAIESILREPGTRKPQKISFKWTNLDLDELVRVDLVGHAILLNSHFRNQIKEGQSKDASVLKITLMFLLQEEFGKAFLTKTSTEKLQRINQALIASMKT